MVSAGLRITHERPDSAEVLAMIREGDAYYAKLYPAESNHLLNLDALVKPNVAFYVARLDSRICGFGAVVDQGIYAELKRMYVHPDARGMGIGKALLLKLELHALDAGHTIAKLETGIRQPEAIALYRSEGFVCTGPFGSYCNDPLSIFMHKELIEGRTSARDR